MKRLLFIMLLALPMPGTLPHHADLSGTWIMNLKKSKNLPPSFKNLEAYKMRVHDSGDSMTVTVEFTGMGQKVSLPPLVYAFDGKERYREDTLRGSKRWTSASWTTTGQKLIVTSRVVQTRPAEKHYSETIIWLLSNSKKLDLLVTQKFEGSDSTNSEQRIFSRAAD